MCLVGVLTAADVVGLVFGFVCIVLFSLWGTDAAGCELRWVADGTLVLGALGLW